MGYESLLWHNIPPLHWRAGGAGPEWIPMVLGLSLKEGLFIYKLFWTALNCGPVTESSKISQEMEWLPVTNRKCVQSYVDNRAEHKSS